LADDAEKLVEGRSDSAFLKIGIEDDHQFVMTHACNPPPLDSVHVTAVVTRRPRLGDLNLTYGFRPSGRDRRLLCVERRPG
jgi:hypothetical protein